MAQSDNPYGLTPYCPDGGTPKITTVPEKSGASFKKGDPLLASTGVGFAATNSTYAGVAAQDSTGVALGDVEIYADPEQWYIVRAGGDTTSLDIGAEIDLAGTTGVVYADQATSTNDDVRFMGYPYKNEDRTAAGHRIFVKFNVHVATPDTNAT